MNESSALPPKYLTYNDGGGGSMRLKQAIAQSLNRRFAPLRPIELGHPVVTNGGHAGFFVWFQLMKYIYWLCFGHGRQWGSENTFSNSSAKSSHVAFYTKWRTVSVTNSCFVNIRGLQRRRYDVLFRIIWVADWR